MSDQRIPAERSPRFVLDESKLRSNLSVLQRVQQEAQVDIILALKAVALWRVFPIFREYLAGATASSLHEAMLISKHMGVKAHTYAPVYTDQEVDEVLALSSHIVFNSIGQWERHGQKALDKGVSVGLRVNPGWSDVQTDKYNPTLPGSRLGIDMLDELPKGVEGLHVHALCESSAESLERVVASLEERFGHLLSQLRWLNLGGGHLITDESYDLQRLIGLLNTLKSKYDIQVILEPGAATVWQAGELIAHVEDIVTNVGVSTIMLDVSFTAHMPDTLEMPYHPKIDGAIEGDHGGEVYFLGGTSCLSGDYIGPYTFQQIPSIGDQLVFRDMIQYTLVKTTMFNGVRHPDILIRGLDGQLKMLRRFDFSDYEGRMC